MSNLRSRLATLPRGFAPRPSRIALNQQFRITTPHASSPAKCTYYSIHHPDPPPFPETQDRILAAALGRVPEYGFTERALALGAKDAGYLDVTVQLFPRGAFDLINYYLVMQRLALKQNVQFPEEGRLGIGAKVKTLVMARLLANARTIHQWQGV
jgi:ubiquinone biosynthesis protein COQ9